MNVWESKTTGETVSRRWEPAFNLNENISTVSVGVDEGTVTATVVSEVDRGSYGVTVFVSGGASGEIARLSVDIATTEGRIITGVFRIGVLAEAGALTETARDICDFALRKVVGNGATPSAGELSDALERLNAMIAIWRMQCIDIGIAKELDANDVLSIPDGFITALKLCLRVDVHEFYGLPLSGLEIDQARDAKETVRAKTLQFKDLSFERGLLRNTAGWDYARGT